MADKKKKLILNMEIQTQFSNIQDQITKFKAQLESLGSSFGKGESFKQYSKYLNDYAKVLNKLQTKEITPKNFENYKESVIELKKIYEGIQNSISSISEEQQQLITQQQTEALSAIDKLQNKILAKRQAAAKKLGVKKADALSIPFTTKTAGQAGYTGDQGKIYSSARSELKKLEQALEDAQKQYDALLKKIPEVGELTKIFPALTAGIRSSEDSAKDLNQQFLIMSQQKASASINSLVTQFFGFHAVLMLARTAVNQFKTTMKELDDSLTSIAAVTGKTRKEMWSMVDTYNEMAFTLGTTTKQIAEASKLYYQQGRTQSEVTELVEQTAILATTAEIDYATATNYLTAAINGYNIEADEAYRVTDSWSALAAASAVDVNELAVAMSKVASLASASGVEIETASALLSKMLETTREAPENLGTALKTIISRFQDLKKSEEELADGVDANKVEAALATAGVALRDSTGQFRDFDTVLMELSKVWDTLSVNTQKYIATVAAGSRQQSRFIALVSDYERNLELIDIAQDSAGASTAQFNIYMDGLQASFNRLTAAWEGFYTSLEQGPTLFSNLIDGLASLINSFNDFGASQSIITIAIAGTIIKLIASAAAYTLNSEAVKENTEQISKNAIANMANGKTLATLKTAFSATRAVAKSSTKAMAANAAATLGAIAPYAGLIAVVAALAGGLIYAATAQKRHIRDLKEQSQAAKEAATTARQQSKGLESIADSYEKTLKTGGDLVSVQQSLIDQYPDIAAEIDLVNDSYEENNRKLKEQINLKKRLSAGETIRSLSAEKDLWVENQMKQSQIRGNYAPLYEIEGKHYLKSEAKEIFEERFSPDNSDINFISEIIIDSLGTQSEAEKAAIKNAVKKDYELLVDTIKDENGEKVTILKDDAAQLIEKSYGPDEVKQSIIAVGNKLQDALLSGLALTTDQAIEEFDNIQSMADELVAKFKEGNANVSRQEFNILEQVFGNTEDWEKYVQAFETQKNTLLKSLTVYGNNAYDNTLNKIWEQSGAKAADAFVQGLSRIKDAKQRGNFNAYALGLTQENKKLISKDSSYFIDTENLLKSVDSSEHAFSMLQKIISDFDTSHAEKEIKFLSNAINLLEIDMQNLVQGPIDDYYKAMDKLKAASQGGIEYTEYIDLLRDYGNVLDETSFGWDEYTGKVTLSSDAALKAAEAIREQKLAEQELNIQTALMTLVTQDSTLASEGLIGSSYEEATAILAKRSAEIEEMMTQQLSIVVSEEARLKTLDKADADYAAAEAALADAAAEYTKLSAMKGNIDAVKGEISQCFNLNNVLKSNTASRNYLKGKQKEGTKATNAQTDALEKQKKALEKNKEALQDQIDALEEQKEALEDARDAAKNYANTLAEAIQNRLNKELEDAQSAVENYYEALDQALSELIENAQDDLDDLSDAADKAKDLAEEDSEALQEQADLVINFYDKQIDAIQNKIDALDKEGDALDRLQKLQEARDAYEQAKQKTRLVLIEGAGWRFRTDKDALQKAGESVATTEVENQTELLEKQIDQLEDIKSKWEEIAKNIGKATSELEKTAAFENFLNGASPEQLNQLYNQFVQSTAQNNTLFENALQAQNRYETQNNVSAEGTLAWQIQQWQNAQEQAQKDKNQFDILTDPNVKAVEELKKQLLQQLGTPSDINISDALAKGLEIININAEVVNNINSTLDALEELLLKMDMTSEEIAQYNEIQNMVGQASLDALLQGGSVYNKLESQIEHIVGLTDQIIVIEHQINALQDQIKIVENQIDNIDDRIQELKDAVKEGTEQLRQDFRHYNEEVKDAIKESREVVVKYPSAPIDKFKIQAKAAQGGVDDTTGLLSVHGTKNRPELVLNNSQSAGLFHFIDSLTKIPSVRNISPSVLGQSSQTSITQNSGTSFENCTFKIESQAESFEGLVADLKRQVPFR